MSVEQQLSEASPGRAVAVTIGTFDGVHRGHQSLFRRLREEAEPRGLLTAAIAFRNQPRSVLNPDARVEYITPWPQRKALIQAQGVDCLAALDFTRELSEMRAAEFVALLVERLRMRLLVVGSDFALGHKREGDFPTLTALGEAMGFEVVGLDSEVMDGQPIRSRALRRMIAAGEVGEAAGMLGRPFSLSGVVIEGARRGRDLGFPTANLAPEPNALTPGNGIYVTWAVVGGERMPSVTSIGVRPTFGPGERCVEVYIMDFSGDIYGETVGLEFVSFLREEAAFSTASALVEQMGRDVEDARTALAQGARRRVAG